jgi:hypothetical protein
VTSRFSLAGSGLRRLVGLLAWVQKVASVSPFSTILFVNLLLANDLASSNLVAGSRREQVGDR